MAYKGGIRDIRKKRAGGSWRENKANSGKIVAATRNGVAWRIMAKAWQ